MLMMVRYNADVNTPTLRNVLGVSNYKEVRAGANLVWTPVTDFDVGVEFICRRSRRPRLLTRAAFAFSVLSEKSS